MILPIYLVGAVEFDDEGRREADDLARELWTRQLADRRELRFEPLTSVVARRAVADLAGQIRSEPTTAPVTSTITPPRFPAAVGPIRRPAPEPPTHVVDADGRGDFATTGSALKAAKAGDRILVRPGLHQKQLVIDKPVELLGDGPREDIEIHARGSHTLVFRASVGRMAGLTLRQLDVTGGHSCVAITAGRPELEECDIISNGSDCTTVHNRAAPRIRRNHVHDGRETGISVYGPGFGLIEENNITGNGLHGLVISTSANPTVRRNRICEHHGAGIVVSFCSRGIVEENTLAGNGADGLAIATLADPTVRRNLVHDNHQAGILIFTDGIGVIEDNDITVNGHAGVDIHNNAGAVVRHNRVHRNAGAGIWIHDNGAGTVEDNDLRDNQNGALHIDATSTALVTSARNQT